MQQVSTSRQSLLDSRPDGVTTWVLDTNVVLDLFVFQDPRCAALALALGAAPGGWVASAAMRAEFDEVMARSELARWAGRRKAALRQWDHLATLVDAAPGAPRELICADADDQMFVDLAVWLRPCWLLSRDAVVLRLKRPAAALGIHIATPAQWEAEVKRGDPIDRPVALTP